MNIKIGNLLKIVDVFDLHKYNIGVVVNIDINGGYYYILSNGEVHPYGSYLVTSGYIEKIETDDSES